MSQIGLEQARANRQLAVFETLFAKRYELPRIILPAGKVVSRAIDRGREWTTARGARTIPPNSSRSKVSRWHGKLEQGEGRGGLNVAADGSALINEGLYRVRFDDGNGEKRERTEPVSGISLPEPALLANLRNDKAMWTFRLREKVQVVDLHASHQQVQRVLRSVAESSSVRNAQKDLKGADPAGTTESLDLIGIMMLPNSWAYPVTRAVGVAALAMGDAQGLAADTVPHETASSSSSKGNVVLGGEDGRELYHLDPEFEVTLDGIGKDGREVLNVRELKADEVASSVTPDTKIEL